MACTSVVFPAPSSPDNHTTLPGGNSSHSRAPSRSSVAGSTSRRGDVAASGTPPPPTRATRAHGLQPPGRAAYRVLARLELEQLVPKLRGELEVQLCRRFAHLLLQRRDQRFTVRGLGRLESPRGGRPFGPRVGHPGHEPNLLDRLLNR